MSGFTNSLEEIDPRNIEDYLSEHGWSGLRREAGRYSTWKLESDERTPILFVPLSRGPVDYLNRVRDLIQRLSDIEGRPDEQIVFELRYAGSDLVRIRLESPRVGVGEVPIDEGRNLFDGVHDMMLAAACAAVEPRASYGPRKSSLAQDYMDGVRLGQTEPGSYVVTVISELEPVAQDALVPDEAAHLQVPFERQVTSVLLESLTAARDAANEVVRASAPISDVFEAAVERGVSANLCDAVSAMASERAATHVAISVSWAASRPASSSLDPIVEFAPEALPVLHEAAASLKKLGPFEGMLIEGFVERLDRGREAESGSVVVAASIEGVPRKVRVELGPEDYRSAISAHDSRLPVEIRGTLLKRGRSWELLEVGPLRVGDGS